MGVFQENPTLKKLKDEASYYKEKYPNYKELLDVYLAVFSTQRRFLPKIKVNFSLPQKEADLKLRRSDYLLKETKGVVVDGNLFKEILNSLIVEVGKKTNLPEGTNSMLVTEELKGKKTDEFVERLKLGDIDFLLDFSKKAKVSPELVFFFTYNALIPFYLKYGTLLKRKVSDEAWLRDYCPICGHRPQLGRLKREGGSRFLQCSYCRTQWFYPKVRCPFCGNENEDELKFFYATEDEGRRAEVCDKCKKYIKVIDERSLKREAILIMEDIVTTYLDTVAKERGYVCGAYPKEVEAGE